MAEAGGKDREALGFAATTREAFAAITGAHGLTERASDLYSVAYHGPPGWLTVIHDRLSYELDIALAPGVGADAERPYGMADLVRAVDPAAAEQYRCFAATTPSEIRMGVDRLAQELRVYGEPGLAGDSGFLEQVELSRQRTIDEFARDRSRARDAAAAADAVRRGDWKAVVALYEPVEEQLDRVEAKRLKLARKRLTGT